MGDDGKPFRWICFVAAALLLSPSYAQDEQGFTFSEETAEAIQQGRQPARERATEEHPDAFDISEEETDLIVNDVGPYASWTLFYDAMQVVCDGVAMSIPPNPPVESGHVRITDEEIVFSNWGPTAVLLREPILSAKFYTGRFVRSAGEDVRLNIGVVVSPAESTSATWPSLEGFIEGDNQGCRFNKQFVGVPSEISEKYGFDTVYEGSGRRPHDIYQTINSFLPEGERVKPQEIFESQIDEDATVEQALPEGLRDLTDSVDPCRKKGCVTLPE